MRLLYISVGGVTLYLIDRNFYSSAITRSLYTFRAGLLTALDYKLNFRAHPWTVNSIEELHARNAERLAVLLRENGGLYLKIGQAIAMQSAVLPPAFQAMFSRMFDDAPQNDWDTVRRVISEEFGGREVEQVFGDVIERKARASASVAQVHWCRLPDGREVAVKVQKEEIASQVGWDLWTFKVVTWIYSKWFDIPFYSLVPYITERLMLETDFENEADNAERMAELVAGESRLRDRVYIPKVYRELTTKRVMTAEWIEGVRLWDKSAITNPWLGPRSSGTPGAHGAPLDGPTDASHEQIASGQVKPERNGWQGLDGKGGLGLRLKDVMTSMVDLFSAQMFLWGWVHCDPHPGNIFIRRLPGGKPELVLIDHGLYIHMDPNFRHQYARFWKALLTFDNATLKDVVQSWGINNADIFASATLMRPYMGGNKQTSEEIRKLSSNESKKAQQERAYEAQQKMRKGIKEILGDGKQWPQELIFIGRNLRIVQGNNQFLGSPVNRIKITGFWASRALVENRHLRWNQRLANWGSHLIFRTVLFTSDVVFWFSKIRQWLGRGRGMEDDLEESMKGMAKEFGVELNHGVFEG